MCFIWLATFFSIILPLVLAQTSSPTSTSSAPATTHSVNVGAVSASIIGVVFSFIDQKSQEGLVFTPNQLTANVGDVVEFRFYPSNHSVARSEFKNPCIPYEDTGAGKKGLWSGFVPMDVVLSNVRYFPTTTVR